MDVDDAINSPTCFQTVDDVYPPRIYIEVIPMDCSAAQTGHLDCQLRLIGTAEDVTFQLTSPPVVRGPDTSAFEKSQMKETPLGMH